MVWRQEVENFLRNVRPELLAVAALGVTPDKGTGNMEADVLVWGGVAAAIAVVLGLGVIKFVEGQNKFTKNVLSDVNRKNGHVSKPAQTFDVVLQRGGKTFEDLYKEIQAREEAELRYLEALLNNLHDQINRRPRRGDDPTYRKMIAEAFKIEAKIATQKAQIKRTEQLRLVAKEQKAGRLGLTKGEVESYISRLNSNKKVVNNLKERGDDKRGQGAAAENGKDKHK